MVERLIPNQHIRVRFLVAVPDRGSGSADSADSADSANVENGL